MRSIMRYAIFCFTFSLILSNQIYKEIKINNPDPNIISVLHQSGVHIDHAHFSDGEYLIFAASGDDLQVINSLDISYEILIEDLELFYQSRLTDNYTREFGLGSMGGYYTFEEIEEHIKALIDSFDAQENTDIVGQMKRIVPEFISKNSDYSKLD